MWVFTRLNVSIGIALAPVSIGVVCVNTLPAIAVVAPMTIQDICTNVRSTVVTDVAWCTCARVRIDAVKAIPMTAAYIRFRAIVHIDTGGIVRRQLIATQARVDFTIG
jgi:hypothetical protein